ncbi:MAG: hypothetical protein LBC89_05570, partial [Bacteroidales bacterium]|nr:hypothetical protein [Bacteroidales bacterium]
MILPVAVAKKLILLQDGNAIPFSKMPTAVIGEMLENGILKKRVHGRKKILVYLPEKQLLDAFLQNHYGISSLQDYVGEITKSDISRARAVLTSSDSKMKKIRTFKGFLVNCYDTIPATIHDRQITLSQGDGTFQFIHDYEHFRLPPETTVVGVENAENFWRIEQQRYL